MAGRELPRATLEAAAHWYVQLNDATTAATERAAWERWLAADASHRQAWARMQALSQRLHAVPGELAGPTLSGARERRRRTLKLLTLLLSGGGTLALLPELEAGWQVAAADLRTATGERRRVVLADGGSLDLNSASAVDVDYGAHLRRLRLLAGEIFVSTAADPRPFEVHTGHGAIRALGTRFGVRLDGATTRVAVHQHAVEIRPLAGPPRRLAAGEEVDFDAAGVSPSQPLTAGSGAWRDGRLIAIDRRLDDFLGELARHRRGHLAWSPAVAGLRLSGVFRLGDSDAVLDNLAASLPIRLHFLTRYWVRVDAA